MAQVGACGIRSRIMPDPRPGFTHRAPCGCTYRTALDRDPWFEPCPDHTEAEALAACRDSLRAQLRGGAGLAKTVDAKPAGR